LIDDKPGTSDERPIPKLMRPQRNQAGIRITDEGKTQSRWIGGHTPESRYADALWIF
jgi:hypothetical protein